jgi:ATP-binding cassette subfamily B multidrug efflux pump
MSRTKRHENRPPGPSPRPFAKPKNAKASMFRIFRYMFEFKIHFIIAVFCILLSSAATVAGTYFLKPLLNNYIVPFIGHQSPDLSGFIGIIFVMIFVYAVGIVSGFTYNLLMMKVSQGSLNRIRTQLFTHMQKLPVRFFDTNTHGDLMSRFTNDTDTLRQMLSQSIPQLISSAVTIIGVFAMMILLSPSLTLLTVIMIFIMLYVVKTIGGKSGKAFKLQQKQIGRINGFIEEMIEGQKVVKVFCHENDTKRDFESLNHELASVAASANTLVNIIMPIMGNLSYIHYAITAAAGALIAVASGNPVVYIGTLASFLQYTRSFSQPITQISQQFNSILTALAGAERIFEVLDTAPETDDGFVTLVYAAENKHGELSESSTPTDILAWKQPNNDGGFTLSKVTGKVEIEDLTFGYEENKNVLKHISLYAKPGQKIAFVGSTGAGKTTITNLINRFYDVPGGNIKFDGIDINKIKKADLRRTMSMVLQDTHLFSGTVADNIRYGNLSATDEAVIEAAKLANAHYFITHLPQSYDTVLSADGSNLSQGQRQLLSIARAAIANPAVLILDEATSSIDTRTERLIEKGMDKLMEGRTVFVIAHRLSTVRNSNAIMVLENGEIIERGDHDALLDLRGKYYQLYTGTSELS